MRRRISIRGCVFPLVRPSVRLSRVIFERRMWPILRVRSSNDIVINNTIGADEVVASDVPPRYLLDATTHLYKRSCPSVRRSHVIFERQKNVFSDVPMTMKFDMHQETVKDN